MNIDEAIEMLKNWSDYDAFTDEQIEKRLFFEQCAEWLEELKMLRKLKDRNRKIRIIEVFNIGYNKAIDDFVEKSNNMKFADKDAKEIFVERVQEIAGQLKAGVENE